MDKCLIAVAVYDTDDNDRTKYTKETYKSLIKTTNPQTTRIFFIDNGSCEKTKEFLFKIKKPNINVITNKENIGTAEAVNLALKERKEGEYCVKMDNDVVIHDIGWVDKLIRCFKSDNEIGILGLKRKDIPNSPYSKEYTTRIEYVRKSKCWDIVELCDDIIGTCTMFNPSLLDKVGYMYQPGIYGFDDVLMSYRSLLSGYYNAFYPGVEIDHIDDGENEFCDWKRKYAGIYLSQIEDIKKGYKEYPETIYYNPF